MFRNVMQLLVAIVAMTAASASANSVYKYNGGILNNNFYGAIGNIQISLTFDNKITPTFTGTAGASDILTHSISVAGWSWSTLGDAASISFTNGIITDWSLGNVNPDSIVYCIDPETGQGCGPDTQYFARATDSGDFYSMIYLGESEQNWSGERGIWSIEDRPDVSAVPLPAALPLLLSGLGIFGIAARRRQQKSN